MDYLCELIGRNSNINICIQYKWGIRLTGEKVPVITHESHKPNNVISKKKLDR